MVKITNSVNVFHLGLIEGGRTSGCKYGYFSDYSVSRGDVVVVETGSKSAFRCYGDTVQLRANGGLSYSWSPSSYLDDPFSATPIVTAPPGVYNYDVTMTRGCFPDTTITVIVGIADLLESRMRDGREFAVLGYHYLPESLELTVELSDNGIVWGRETIEARIVNGEVTELTTTGFRLQF